MKILILRVDIIISRFKIYMLDRLFFLPHSLKVKYLKKVCKDIVRITNEVKKQKII